MVGCHYRLNGHEFEQTPGDGEGWRSLARCSPWGRKDSDMTEQLSLHFTLHIKPVEEYLAFTMLTDYYYSFISRSHPTSHLFYKHWNICPVEKNLLMNEGNLLPTWQK